MFGELILLSTMLAAKYTCPLPLKTNLTEFPWNAQDEAHYVIAKGRCASLYRRSPCLAKFIKNTASDYSVSCVGKIRTEEV
jgi:hypothetical protein